MPVDRRAFRGQLWRQRDLALRPMRTCNLALPTSMPADRRALRGSLWRQRGFAGPRRDLATAAAQVRRAPAGAFAHTIAEDGLLFAAFGTERLLRVRAVHALFEVVGLGAVEPLKVCVWQFLDEPVAWQFQADRGWLDCDSATQRALLEAEAKGQVRVTLRVRSWAYDYDLHARSQINLSTGRARPLRRRNPWAAAQPPVGPDAPAEGLHLPRWQFSTGFGWADCDEDTQRLLRQAENSGESNVRVRLRHWDYLLDLAAGTQTNVATGRARELRRLPPPAVVATSERAA